MCVVGVVKLGYCNAGSCHLFVKIWFALPFGNDFNQSGINKHL